MTDCLFSLSLCLYLVTLSCSGLMTDFGHEVASVAVLTPYKAQLALLRSTFARHHSKSVLGNVEFATVDGFQVAPPHNTEITSVV